MSLNQSTNLALLPNKKISKAIITIENELFNLRFKKATRQSFKSHEIKKKRRQLAYLKNILTIRLHSIENKKKGFILYLVRKPYKKPTYSLDS